MTETILLEEQTIRSFEYDTFLGVYVAYVDPAPFVLEIGKTYKVLWDGMEYICIALDGSVLETGAVFIGNGEMAGIAGNGEPFAIGGTTESPLNVMSLMDTGPTPHSVAVYELTDQDVVPVPSADVKIKGYSGSELAYRNVPKVYLAAPESTQGNPVLVPFTYGEAVDGVEVIPDFSAGDMEIMVPDGYLARSAIVKKPDSLLPENIRKGQSVAGVTGEYEGSAVETEAVTKTADFSNGNMLIQPTKGKYLESVTVKKPETLIPENIAEGVDIAGILGTFLGNGGAEGGSTGLEDFNVFAKIWDAPTGTSTSTNQYVATASELVEHGIELKTYQSLWTAVLVISLTFPIVSNKATPSMLKFAYRQCRRLAYYASQYNILQGVWMRQTDQNTPAVGYAYAASSSAAENDITNATNAYPGLSPTYGLFFNYNATSATRPIGPYLCIVLQHKTKYDPNG